MRRENRDGKLRELFEDMDRDGDGEITAHELTKFINNSDLFSDSGMELSKDDGWMLMERLDMSGNNRITYDDFKDFVRSKEPLSSYVPVDTSSRSSLGYADEPKRNNYSDSDSDYNRGRGITDNPNPNPNILYSYIQYTHI